MVANKGLITLEQGADITEQDAIRAFDQEIHKPKVLGNMVAPPFVMCHHVLVVSSSSDTDEQDFDYNSSDDVRCSIDYRAQM